MHCHIAACRQVLFWYDGPMLTRKLCVVALQLIAAALHLINLRLLALA